jgi:N-acyl-D-amino-acid deacylase
VDEDRVLNLSSATRKITSFPAQRLGLPDRGLLRDADLVVVDPRTVKAPATRTRTQFPVGIDYVIVIGKVVVDGGWILSGTGTYGDGTERGRG